MALEDEDDESLLKRCFVLRDRVVVGGQRGDGGSEEEYEKEYQKHKYTCAYTQLLCRL